MSRSLSTTRGVLLSLAVLALVTACVTGPPTPEVDYKGDYNFSAVKKIAFYDESGLVSGNNPIPLSDMQRERIDTALAHYLRGKGYQILEQKDAHEAQLLLSWNLISNDKTDVRTYETPTMGAGMGRGYGRYGGYNRYSMYNCWGCTQTEVSVSNYTEGTFIVDMIDPKLKQSVWRGVTQSRLKGKVQTDQDKYNAAADNIMASFPPP